MMEESLEFSKKSVCGCNSDVGATTGSGFDVSFNNDINDMSPTYSKKEKQN